MAEYVDVVVAPEYESAASKGLFQWNKLHGENSVLWVVGESGDGRKVFFDIPTDVVAFLREQGIPCDTRPRDPRRPLPT